MDLGRIGLNYRNNTLNASMIASSRQTLELWKGTITSRFQVEGVDVEVITQGHFHTNSVAFDIKSDLVQSGDLQVEMDFPYPPIHSTKYKYEV